jgi:Calcineurin-like phosphoesterase
VSRSAEVVRRSAAWLFAAGCCIAAALPVSAACTKDRCRILVAGDMGIGDDAFGPGFAAVQKGMVEDAPDLVLYAGDYIYTRQTCEWQAPPTGLPPYVAEVRDKLVAPFDGRVVFAAGDNDIPDGNSPYAQAARRCWASVAGMGLPLTKPQGAGSWEGLIEDLPGILVAVLDPEALLADPASGPDLWLRAPVERAKRDGKWVLVMIHEPVVTTAWYSKPCCATIKPLHDLGVDLVLSGHQHSFERTYPLQVTTPPDRVQPAPAADTWLYDAGVYRAGEGIVYVVTGGGGAWLRPFADQQLGAPPERVAPDFIRSAVARRAVMNNYVRVDAQADRVIVSTMQVCTTGEPRWKPHSAEVWPNGPAMLECYGKPDGTSVFDRFEVQRP